MNWPWYSTKAMHPFLVLPEKPAEMPLKIPSQFERNESLYALPTPTIDRKEQFQTK